MLTRRMKRMPCLLVLAAVVSACGSPEALETHTDAAADVAVSEPHRSDVEHADTRGDAGDTRDDEIGEEDTRDDDAAPDSEDAMLDADANDDAAADATDAEGTEHDAPDGAAADADAPEASILSADVSLHPELSLVGLVSLETDRAARVSVIVALDAAEQFRTGQTETGTWHELSIVGLRAETTYQLTAVLHGGASDAVVEIGELTTGALPDDLVAFEVEVRVPDPSRGITLFAPFGANGTEGWPATIYVGVDGQGEVVWYARGNVQMRAAAIDQLPGGSFFAAYGPSFGIVDRSGLVETAYAGPGGGQYHHDATLLPNGNLLGLVYQTETFTMPLLPEPTAVRFDVITEATVDGEIVDEWRMVDHLDVSRFPSPGFAPEDGRALDWSHANAITYDPSDDTFMVSIRHQHWVIKVDRGTGEIVWRLGDGGDFELIEGEWFYAQHAHEIGSDGSLLLFDNGNFRPGDGPEYSRAVRYELDEEAMTARQVWEHRVDTFSQNMSAATRAPGGYLITAWSDERDSQIYEVDHDGEIVWRLTTPGRVFRATRIPSFYP